MRVDASAGLSRRDGRIQVVLPDGSASLLPVEWIDRGIAPSADAGRSATKPTLLTLEGVRRLRRLIDAIVSKEE